MIVLNSYRITALIFFMMLPALSLADEIRVLDQNGLLRAYSTYAPGVRIRVLLPPDLKVEKLSLTNIDQITRDIEATVSGSGEAEFTPETAGSWKVAGLSETVSLKQAEILAPHEAKLSDRETSR